MATAKKKKNGLGKGLDALFSGGGDTTESFRDILGSTESEVSKDTVLTLKIREIEPNPEQPRKYFREEDLESLADSIKQHGLVQPILVTPTKSGTYRIVAGERRWRAAKRAGIKELPCIAREFDERQIMELALIENLHREDLNPMEEAEGYQALMDKFSLTQEDIAKRVGKSRSAIANALRLQHLCDEVKQMVVNGTLSSGHARTLVPVTDKALQLSLAKRMAEDGMSVRGAEALVASATKPKKAAPVKKNSLTANYYREVEHTLESRFGTKVNIREGAKKGKIEIEYYSRDDLERILFELKQ